MKRKIILVTGSTGFLGSYLARELFEIGYHLKLLMRKRADVQGKERIPEVFPALTGIPCGMFNDRIEVIEGDVCDISLGLDRETYLRLANSVDEVFHCAAATKFGTTEDSILVNTNVYGTEHIFLFCLSNKLKRLHYISTAYVAGTRRERVFEHELEKRQSFNNTYEKSKFEAERFLGQFTKKHGIPVTIYRPSIIIGDSRTGFTKNYDNIYAFGKGLNRYKNYEMRARNRRFINGINYRTPLRVPGDKYSTLNLVPVDYVTRAIIEISAQKKSINSTFHMVNPSPPTLGELAEWMKTIFSIRKVKIVPLNEFQLSPHTRHEKLLLQGTKALLPYMFGEPYFDSTGTRNLLRGTGIECPLITQEFVNNLMVYAANTKWGKRK
ncbi:MAG: NAD-dependent epimerase/dehydratase family protein [wastewater metagenome]|nr:NAD-dependent epimerase/dehydratase family protein [Candidatus Loosdrechtia aerotolerans]